MEWSFIAGQCTGDGHPYLFLDLFGTDAVEFFLAYHGGHPHLRDTLFITYNGAFYGEFHLFLDFVIRSPDIEVEIPYPATVLGIVFVLPEYGCNEQLYMLGHGVFQIAVRKVLFLQDPGKVQWQFIILILHIDSLK